MGLKDRLNRLELKVRSTRTALDQPIEYDQILAKLGLAPAEVRELARAKTIWVAESTAEMLGQELSEFKRQLRAMAFAGR